MVYNKVWYALLLIGTLCGGGFVHAQDVLVTGLEQVSALKGYVHTAEDGYRIVTDGLHLIGDIKGAEVNLHRVFFGSLKEVDEAVLHDPGMDDAFAEVAAANRLLDQALKTDVASGWMQPWEIQYLAAVQQRVAADGQANVAALQTILQDGTLSMTDGERLQHIRKIQGEIHARCAQVSAYVVGIGRLVTERAKEQAFIQTLKKSYGLQ